MAAGELELQRKSSPMFRLTILLFIWECNGTILIYPSNDTNPYYESNPINIYCRDSSSESISLDWFVNGSNLSGNSTVAGFVNAQSDRSEVVGVHHLRITMASIEFHNTSVQCKNAMDSSKKITIYVQGEPPAVSNLTVSVDEDNLLSINWTRSKVYLGDVIYKIKQEYTNVSSECVTEQTSIPVDGIREGSCNNNTLPGSQCGDFNYTITPIITNMKDQNLTGPPSSISLISKDISISNYKRYKNDWDENFNVLLNMNTAICVARCQWRRLKSSLDYEICRITLKSVIGDINNYQYIYISNLQLPHGFRFELDLKLNNSIDHHSQNIVISTHRLRNVTLSIIKPGLLNIRQIYFDNSSNTKWSFLSLLMCQNKDCKEIDYVNSIFFLIKNEECNISYSPGYYQVYAFDVNDEGAINPSSTLKAYPAFNQFKNFTYIGGWKRQTSNPNNCSFVYKNGQVCSSCTNPSFEENSRQQIVLLPKDNNKFITNGISISMPGEVNEKICLQNESDDYYAIAILVTQFDDMIYNQPIAKSLVANINFADTPTLVMTTTTTEPSVLADHKIALIVIFPIIFLVIIIILEVIAYFCYKRRFRTEATGAQEESSTDSTQWKETSL